MVCWCVMYVLANGQKLSRTPNSWTYLPRVRSFYDWFLELERSQDNWIRSGLYNLFMCAGHMMPDLDKHGLQFVAECSNPRSSKVTSWWVAWWDRKGLWWFIESHTERAYYGFFFFNPNLVGFFVLNWVCGIIFCCWLNILEVCSKILSIYFFYF